jgi:sugar-specific transcriptional regulator TrmB
MIIYNQAFDLYHTVYRILQLLNRFEEKTAIEIERIRIWDFYLLFPRETHDITLKRSEGDIRKLRKEFIRKTSNPYDKIPEKKKVFEKIKPYQIAALNCLASYNIIDKVELLNNKAFIVNKELLTKYVDQLSETSATEKNVISLMTGHFFQISLYGSDGLKSRTHLMESKYDA